MGLKFYKNFYDLMLQFMFHGYSPTAGSDAAYLFYNSYVYATNVDNSSSPVYGVSNSSETGALGNLLGSNMTFEASEVSAFTYDSYDVSASSNVTISSFAGRFDNAYPKRNYTLTFIFSNSDTTNDHIVNSITLKKGAGSRMSTKVLFASYFFDETITVPAGSTVTKTITITTEVPSSDPTD